MKNLNPSMSALVTRVTTAIASAITTGVSSAALAGSTYMPPQATKTAGEVDSIYSFLLVSSLISFILIMGGLFWFIYKYQRKSANDKNGVHHSRSHT